MSAFDTLAAIADAYTPLLAAACLLVLLRGLQWQTLRLRMASLATGALVAYGLMFIDHRFAIWPAAGLDYSTHTAVALVLVMFLSVHLPAARRIGWLSLLAYALLMVYQRYHTFVDILSTAAVVGMLYAPALLRLRQRL